MSLIFATIPPKRLAQGITSSSSTFYINNILGFDGLTDVAVADLGTQHYCVFRNDTGTRIEIMEIDPATISTGPITIVRRGLSYYGDRTTETAALKLDWSANETIVQLGTDAPQIFQYLKEYIDAASVAGAVPASQTALGIVEEATQSEVNAGTESGSLGKLFATPDKLLALVLAKTQLLYPIGSIYLSAVSTNPNTLFGFGTWVAWGEGRVPIGVGTGTKVATFASRSSNVITVTGISNKENNEFQTGQAVLYSAPSGAITGLTHNTTYYIVKTGNLTFSLASSLANAQNETVISLSSDGTGAQTFTLTLTARAADETGGEENHAMNHTELLAVAAHTHGYMQQGGGGLTGKGITFGVGILSAYESGSTFGPSGDTNYPPIQASGSFGGNAAMNNMQPFITCYMWKRTA